MTATVEHARPKARKPVVSQSRLRELLSYDPGTGIFRWLVEIRAGANQCRINARIGDIAGSIDNDGLNVYIRIRIDGRLYYAHRLAWFFVNGYWPKLIDHSDRVGVNNRINNLREATRSQNAANSRRPRDNTSGKKGVHRNKESGRFEAYIGINGLREKLGDFDSLEDAARVYAHRARELFGDFAHIE